MLIGNDETFSTMKDNCFINYFSIWIGLKAVVTHLSSYSQDGNNVDYSNYESRERLNVKRLHHDNRRDKL